MVCLGSSEEFSLIGEDFSRRKEGVMFVKIGCEMMGRDLNIS